MKGEIQRFKVHIFAKENRWRVRNEEKRNWEGCMDVVP